MASAPKPKRINIGTGSTVDIGPCGVYIHESYQIKQNRPLHWIFKGDDENTWPTIRSTALDTTDASIDSDGSFLGASAEFLNEPPESQHLSSDEQWGLDRPSSADPYTKKDNQQFTFVQQTLKFPQRRSRAARQKNWGKSLASGVDSAGTEKQKTSTETTQSTEKGTKVKAVGTRVKKIGAKALKGSTTKITNFFGTMKRARQESSSSVQAPPEEEEEKNEDQGPPDPSKDGTNVINELFDLVQAGKTVAAGQFVENNEPRMMSTNRVTVTNKVKYLTFMAVVMDTLKKKQIAYICYARATDYHQFHMNVQCLPHYKWLLKSVDFSPHPSVAIKKCIEQRNIMLRLGKAMPGNCQVIDEIIDKQSAKLINEIRTNINHQQMDSSDSSVSSSVASNVGWILSWFRGDRVSRLVRKCLLPARPKLPQDRYWEYPDIVPDPEDEDQGEEDLDEPEEQTEEAVDDADFPDNYASELLKKPTEALIKNIKQIFSSDIQFTNKIEKLFNLVAHKPPGNDLIIKMHCLVVKATMEIGFGWLDEAGQSLEEAEKTLTIVEGMTPPAEDTSSLSDTDCLKNIRLGIELRLAVIKFYAGNVRNALDDIKSINNKNLMSSESTEKIFNSKSYYVFADCVEMELRILAVTRQGRDLMHQVDTYTSYHNFPIVFSPLIFLMQYGVYGRQLEFGTSVQHYSVIAQTNSTDMLETIDELYWFVLAMMMRPDKFVPDMIQEVMEYLHDRCPIIGLCLAYDAVHHTANYRLHGQRGDHKERLLDTARSWKCKLRQEILRRWDNEKKAEDIARAQVFRRPLRSLLLLNVRLKMYLEDGYYEEAMDRAQHALLHPEQYSAATVHMGIDTTLLLFKEAVEKRVLDGRDSSFDF